MLPLQSGSVTAARLPLGQGSCAKAGREAASAGGKPLLLAPDFPSAFERTKIHLIGSSEKTIRALVIMSCIT